MDDKNYLTNQPGNEPANNSPIGIYTDGAAPAQSAIINTEPAKKTHSKTISVAVIAILFVAVLGAGIFFLLNNSNNSSKKTIADFENIMSSIGYTKATNSSLSYDGPEGAFTTYGKGSSTLTDGVAMFYVVESKEKLKNLIEKEAGDEVNSALANFDWSKERNELEQCNNKSPYICMDFIQIDNTMLIAYYHSNSLDETKSEIAKVVNAMGYQK